MPAGARLDAPDRARLQQMMRTFLS